MPAMGLVTIETLHGKALSIYNTYAEAVSISKMRNCTKTKNHTFPTRKVLDPIHRLGICLGE
jgi:hypothetical protein